MEDGEELVAPGDEQDPGMVKGPFAAETFQISREGKYVVLDVPS